MKRQRLVVMVAALAVLVLGAAGVGVARSASGEARGGPLRTEGGGQGLAMTAPDATPWNATYGSILLCTEASEGITIDRVSVATALAPRRITFWMRHGDEVPVGSALGSPPDFSERYASPRPEGSFEPLRAGALVTVSCGPRSRAVPVGQELFVTMQAGRLGGRVGPLSIHYTAGTRHWVQVVDYDMIACGTSVKVRGMCR